MWDNLFTADDQTMLFHLSRAWLDFVDAFPSGGMRTDYAGKVYICRQAGVEITTLQGDTIIVPWPIIRAMRDVC